MKQKKLIIFMPSIEGGGVEKNLFLVSNFLAKKLNGLTLITISKKYSYKFNNLIKIKSFKSDFWDNQSRYLKYFLSLIILIFEIIKDRNRIVFSFQANIFCIIVCKIFFVKVIVRSNSAPIGWSKNPLKRLLFKIILNLSDDVMVNSQDFKSDLKKEFNVISKCIYNPLDKDIILEKSKSKAKKFFKKDKKLKILNIGRFTEQKDQITLLKSLKIINNKIDFQAIIVGRGILKNKLKKKIFEFNLSKNVKILNFQKNPFPIIKQSNLFILSSKYEGLPNVLLESLVLKKFIISSNCRTGPREILQNGKGGFLFEVGDHKKLAKQIIFYYRNKRKCNQMLLSSLNGLSRFDYNKNLNEYYLLIKKFI